MPQSDRSDSSDKSDLPTGHTFITFANGVYDLTISKKLFFLLHNNQIGK